MAAPQASGLDVTNLDPVVHQLCKKGIAQSTQKTYDSAIKRFTSFCSLYSIASPFPVSEPILCYYAAYLSTQRLAPQTIKTYLAAIRYMQVLLGLYTRTTTIHITSTPPATSERNSTYTCPREPIPYKNKAPNNPYYIRTHTCLMVTTPTGT